MTGSGVIDVAIGLVVSFFLLSLVCSGLNEFVAGLFNLRGRFLSESLEKLLGPELRKKLYDHALIRGLSRMDVPTASSGTEPKEPRKKPSYIPPKTFAVALQALLAEEARLGKQVAAETDPARSMMLKVKSGLQHVDAGVKDALTAVTADVADDLEQWRKRVETWFEETMGRVSGWYKRRIRGIVFGFAVVVTLALNADAVRMAVTLWRDKAVREAVVARVQAVQATPIPCPTPTEGEESDPLDLIPMEGSKHPVLAEVPS